MRRFITTIALISSAALAQSRLDRWAAILDKAPVAEKVTHRNQLISKAAIATRSAVEADQSRIRQTLESEKIPVLGSSQLLLNAVYFAGSVNDAEKVKQLPGVKRVIRLQAYKRLADDKAVQLVNAPAAWNSLGGAGNAGAGRRIGILDSGIDQNHPALTDSTLSPPEGFPKGNDLSYTSKKVIVARSYVQMLVLGDQPEYSRPDDLSPRDRDGHGTAVAMLAAGVQTNGPAATVFGTAPKAFLGNYKIFGSPGVNDLTFANVVIQALEDAAVDGMDVVTLSLGSPATWGPQDTGSFCGLNPGEPCDPMADAIQNAATLNMAVVVAAGNSGDDGFNLPTLGSINSPGTAPAAITVGAFTNAHVYNQSASVENGPSNLSRVNIRFGKGPVPKDPLKAPAVNVTVTGDDGKACRPLGNDTLKGFIAIVQRGDCLTETKVIYAQRSGAVGVVIVQYDGSNSVFPLDGLSNTGIPSVLMGSNDGQTLKNYLQSNPNAKVTLDPAFVQVDAPANEIAYFSSQGPAMGTGGIKPELTSTGTDLYAATQTYDPNSGLYSKDGYLSVQGTSFSVPLVAGAVAMVKQKNPSWNAAQLKSAVVNTANPNDLTDFDSNGQPFNARVNSTGAGKLDAGQALNATISASPAAISFGVVNSGSSPQGLLVMNTTNAAVNLRVDVNQRDNDARARVSVTPASFSLSPGQTTQLNVALTGSVPNPGSYEGALAISGSGATLRIPYQYIVGNGIPYNIFAIANNGFIGQPNGTFDLQNNPFLAKVLDQFGAPVARTNVQWRVVNGSGRIITATAQTDIDGVAAAGIQLGPELGEQSFSVTAGNLTQYFNGRTILPITIGSGQVKDAASGNVGRGLAPGSYVSIYGSGLSEVTHSYSTNYLPVSLSNVSVSFDAPAQRISAPGHLSYVSDGQINVQIPWEFQGLNTVKMKVSIGNFSSAVYDVPLNEYSVGIFEYDDSTSGRRLAASLDESYQTVSGANPVARGAALQLFINGLGKTTNQPASGDPSPFGDLARTLAQPAVSIGGQAAAVEFSGMAPGLVGLYQVNVRVPAGVPTGIQPLTVSIGGVPSQTSQIAVK